VSAIAIILTVLFAAIGLAALVGLACLWRMLDWQEVEDDRLQHEIAGARRRGRGWLDLRRWFAPQPRLLTYRRDRLGRFRRYRR
jgi:hypothetical protein